MSKGRPVRVLIAEDDYLVGEEIERMLKQLDYEIVGIAGNGVKAVKMAESLRPDVVIMDVQMPKLDGFSATRQIQERCPTPVVILTAYESAKLVEQAAEVGASAFLTKPPDARRAEQAITMALARHRDVMTLRSLNKALSRTNNDLKRALDEIGVLRGILPICSYCKKIRDDEGNWKQVEVYIREHTAAQCSHSLCPGCAKKHYPDFM